ncbi:MAG: guanylate kinase [Gemmatimonadota bacterium]
MSYPLALCAPSGTGKTTVARALLDRHEDMLFSISATTRPPRASERDGVDYHFVNRDRFESMIADGELLEWAEVHGELYGTPVANLEDAAREGRILLLDIDVQGARQVVAARSDTLAIFLLPPSSAVLLARLRGRASEDPAELRRRLATAKGELAVMDQFEHVVINDELEAALREIGALIRDRSTASRPAAQLEDLRSRLLSDLEKLGT